MKIFEDFLVVGEGGYLAQAALMHREHTDVYDLNRTIYCVYEAKRHAERVSSVNDRRTMIILSSDGSHKHMGVKGLQYLEEIYNRISQKPIPDDVTVTNDHYNQK